jgi:hypothetical protein
MDTTAIDSLTKDFYKSISFNHAEPPEFAAVKILFFGDGILINNSFRIPITFTVESFIDAVNVKVAEGSIEQFMEREIHSKTEIFGKVAQRVSVYEFNFADHAAPRLPKGINFIQFICTEGKWRILSMAWFDENENHIIPQEYLHSQLINN